MKLSLAKCALFSAIAFPSATALAAGPSCDDPAFSTWNTNASKVPVDLKGELGAAPGWIPQGFAYHAGSDALFVSFYDKVASNGVYENSMLVAYDRSTGALKNRVYFHPSYVPAGGHVGGLAIDGNNLYVANTRKDGGNNVTVYSLLTVLSTQLDHVITPTHQHLLPAASYAGAYAGRLFVGDFEGNIMYEFQLNSNGSVGSRLRTIRTPAQVQGVAVNARTITYSTSFDRDYASTLATYDRSSLQYRNGMFIPNMSQGITWIPMFYKNQWTTAAAVIFESGAQAYPGASCVQTQAHALPESIMGM